MELGERIRELRTEKGLYQRELAEKIHIAPNTLSQFESGKAKPSYEVLTAIADFFECSIDFLLGREDDFGNITVSDKSAEAITTEERQLLHDYRLLSVKEKAQIKEHVELFLERYKK
ncbi:MAG: helix-turn-helix transcriptional regulator [Clostridiales bacterium]|nr:helix-turn-helix transcriptional regulator [Clostridiales bacterium]